MTHICPQCTTELPSDAPSGLCPMCLIEQAFVHESKSVDDDVNVIYRKRFQPLSLEELNKRLPDLEVLELIGQGGMGAVYKARQSSLDRIVAVKVLLSELNEDPSFTERFTREAKSLAKLHHAHIVTIFDFGQQGDLYYLTMEYVDGLNLREIIGAGEVTPAEALAGLIYGIAYYFGPATYTVHKQAWVEFKTPAEVVGGNQSYYVLSCNTELTGKGMCFGLEPSESQTPPTEMRVQLRYRDTHALYVDLATGGYWYITADGITVREMSGFDETVVEQWITEAKLPDFWNIAPLPARIAEVFRSPQRIEKLLRDDVRSTGAANSGSRGFVRAEWLTVTAIIAYGLALVVWLLGFVVWGMREKNIRRVITT